MKNHSQQNFFHFASKNNSEKILWRTVCYSVEYMDEIRNWYIGLNQSDSFYKNIKGILNV